MFPVWTGRTMSIATGAAELARAFVGNVLVLLAWAGRAMSVGSRIAVATLAHGNTPKV